MHRHNPQHRCRIVVKNREGNVTEIFNPYTGVTTKPEQPGTSKGTNNPETSAPPAKPDMDLSM